MLAYVKFPNLKVRKLHSLQCSLLTFTLFICIWRLLWEGVCWSKGWKTGIIQREQTIKLLKKGDCSTYKYSSDGSATKHKNLFPTVHCLQADCLNRDPDWVHFRYNLFPVVQSSIHSFVHAIFWQIPTWKTNNS